MLDGDHTIEEAWRLRQASFRMYQECRHRSIEYCNHAFNLLKTFEGHAHIWTRMFPTLGAVSYFVNENTHGKDELPRAVTHLKHFRICSLADKTGNI